MTGTTRVPPAEITGLYGALMKMAARKMIGQVPDSVGVMWHNPRGVQGPDGASGARPRSGTRSTRTWRSFASMAAAAAVGCSFCLDLHYFMAHNHGLDEAKAREVPRWRESTCSRRPSAA